MRRPILLGAFVTLLLPTKPVAAWPTDPDISVPIAVAPFVQTQAQIAVDGAGGAYITWSDSRSGADFEIYAQHVLASGIVDPGWPLNGHVLCATTGNQSFPKIVADGVGGAIVVWRDLRTLSNGYDIYAHHVLASGPDPAWPVNGRAICVLAQSQINPDLVSDGAGGAIIVWDDERNTNDFDVYAQRVLANGAVAWTPNGRAVCTASREQIDHALVPDGAGGAIVTWRDDRNLSSSHDIYAQRLLSSGSVDPAWPVNGRALCTAALNQNRPVAVADGAGGAIVTWEDHRNEDMMPNTDIYAQHVLAGGAVDPVWPANGLDVCTESHIQNVPDVASDGAGGAIVAWVDQRTSVPGRAYSQHVLGTGAVDPGWTAGGLALAPLTNGQTFPHLVADGAGGAIVAWVDLRTSPPSDVYAQHVLASGVVDGAWPTAARAVSTAPRNDQDAYVVPDGSGGAIVVWVDYDDYDVYAQRVTNRGSLGVGLGETGASLPGSSRGALAWGDYDGDGDLDLVMAGIDGEPHTRLLRNDAGSFVDVGAGLPGVVWSSLAWGDYDGDRDLDLALAGYSYEFSMITRVYRNTAGSFTDLGGAFPGLFGGSVTWADYDNDGDLDLLAVGQEPSLAAAAHLYRNDAGTFTEVTTGLEGVYYSDAAWGDYDGDGDLDVVVAGFNGTAASTRLYRNDGGVLVDSGMGLAGVLEGDLAWGDFDEDGDLDLLLAGWDGGSRHCDVYHNLGGSLFDFGSNPPGLSSCAAAWGDYDNDGDLDVFASGYWDGGGGLSRIYRNQLGSFSDAGMGLPGLFYSALAPGDYDNDGDLDLALSGTPDFSTTVLHLYRSSGATPNLPPTAPGNLSAFRSGNQVTFNWTPGNDDHTVYLTYNLLVRTAGGVEVMPAMSAGSGWRRVPRLGNVQERMSWTLTLPPGGYEWEVQAVDGAFLGSQFATGPTIVGVENGLRPGIAMGLGVAAPNPFRSSTELLFALSEPARTSVEVFDASGRRVRTLAAGEWPAGEHSLRWDGRDDAGRALEAGLYLVRMNANGRHWGCKLVITR